MTQPSKTVSQFMERHFRHFNARETLAAARAYRQHINDGGKMVLALAGAMSTAEIGISLAQMIRADKVHAVSCTAANLEEDLFNLLGNKQYRILDSYRDLTPKDETALRDEGFNRVTDTCIPETVVQTAEELISPYWIEAGRNQESFFFHEFFYRLLDEQKLPPAQVPLENSWLVAAWEKRLPIYTPGFEDSTLGNILSARVMQGKVETHQVVRTGTEQMQHLVQWYLEQQASSSVGFFQIGGGIAGDFAICAVPLILQDLQRDCRLWEYFAQIGDSTTSFGSYSGAVPNEKITWHKLPPDAPRFMINSDASIVAPLIFAYVLEQ